VEYTAAALTLADPFPYQATDTVSTEVISRNPVQHDGLTGDDITYHGRNVHYVNMITGHFSTASLCPWVPSFLHEKCRLNNSLVGGRRNSGRVPVPSSATCKDRRRMSCRSRRTAQKLGLLITWVDQARA